MQQHLWFFHLLLQYRVSSASGQTHVYRYKITMFSVSFLLSENFISQAFITDRELISSDKCQDISLLLFTLPVLTLLGPEVWLALQANPPLYCCLSSSKFSSWYPKIDKNGKRTSPFKNCGKLRHRALLFVNRRNYSILFILQCIFQS